MTRKLHVNVGKRRSSASMEPWEAGYVQSVRASTKSVVDAVLSILSQFEDVSTDIMLEVLEPTFEKALDYTPVDTGALVRSGYLLEASFRGKPRVEMGFAQGGFPDYAVIVHENMEMFHEPPTRAKFLESAMFEDLGDMYGRLAAAYQDFMNSGSR